MAHVAQRPGLDDAAEPDDAHAVGQLLDLGQDVAGEQHGLAGGLRLEDDVLEDDLHQRVEPRGGFVEQQQLRVGGERGDDGDLLPVALGVGAALLRRVEVEALDQLVPAGGVEAAPQAGEQVDGLAAGEAGPQLDVAGYVGESAVQGDGVVPRVVAEQPCGAGVGAQQAEEYADGGGLTGAVRAEEAVHLPGPDVEIEAVERAQPAEGLHETGNRDRGGGCVHGFEATLLS
jgi:hypothetical protein